MIYSPFCRRVDLMSSVMLICPVSEAKHYEGVKLALEAAVAEAGADLVKPDYEPLDPKFDLGATKTAMLSASLIVVDLSYERPSCYYELGVREAVGARLLLVARVGTTVHQTSLREQVNFFSDPVEVASAVLRAIL